MKKIHCNGCGMSEELDAPKHVIGPVTMTFELDPRDWATDKKFEADLCPTCISTLLHNYFGIKAEGSTEIPAFIQPSLRVVDGRR